MDARSCVGYCLATKAIIAKASVIIPNQKWYDCLQQSYFLTWLEIDNDPNFLASMQQMYGDIVHDDVHWYAQKLRVVLMISGTMGITSQVHGSLNSLYCRAGNFHVKKLSYDKFSCKKIS